MTKTTSKKRVRSIIIALIPVFIAASCTFSSKNTETDIETVAVNPVIDYDQIITRGNGVSQELVSEYQTIVDKYFEKIVTGNPNELDKLYWKANQLAEEDWTRLYFIYVQMDENQQKEQKIRFGEAPHYSDNMKAFYPNRNYNGWKTDKNCHVWIDGKKVDNSVLNSYDKTDFFAFHVSSLSKGENEFDFRVDFWTENGLKAFSRQVFEQPVSVGKLLEIKPIIHFVMEQKNDDFVYVHKNYGSRRGWFEISVKVTKKTETEWHGLTSTTNGGSSPLAYHRSKEMGLN